MNEPALRVETLPATQLSGHVLDLVRARLAADKAPGDLAVLARVNSALLPVQVMLTAHGIAHTAPLDTTVLNRTGVRASLAYLRIGLDPARIARSDVLETINRPARKVRSAVEPLLRRRTTWTLAQLEQVSASLDDTHRERFEDYLADLELLADAVQEGAEVAHCLQIVRTEIGLDEAIDVLDRSRTRPEGSSHGDDLDALVQLAVLHPDPGTFAPWLREQLSAPGDPAGVTLSTVHRVKGMQWSHVVVFAANQGLFPHRLAEDLEEERRVFHVALTRCEATVTVLADAERPSPFLRELHTAADPTPAPGPASTAAGHPDPGAGTRLADGRTVAERGLGVALAGGLRGRVVEVLADRAVVVLQEPLATSTSSTGALRLEVVFGEPVTIGGQPTRLAAAAVRRTAGLVGGDVLTPDDGQDPELFEALRAWRASVAARAGQPPFLVFHDRHLRELAARKPRTERELAACPGVGPAKLERYADDLLDLIGEHVDAAGAALD